MKKSIIFTFLILIFLTSCSIDSVKISDGDAKDLVHDMKYIKDHSTGLCFGVVGYKKGNAWSDAGVTMTCVPCDSVKNLLINLEE